MKIQLTTLSPLHIGSGIQHDGNAGYLHFQQENMLVVIDEAKVLGIIGIENIHHWIDFIENKQNNFLAYLRQRKPGIKPEDVAARLIPLNASHALYHTNTLREQIHNGMGLPYIPGSSLKGAIRTSVFADILMATYKGKGISERQVGEENRYNRKFVIKDKFLQSEVFGKNPNEDWFRMLQVGDCYFPAGQTRAGFAEALNETGNARYSIKQEVRQLVEYIPPHLQADMAIHIPTDHLALIQQRDANLFRSHSRGFNMEDLFKQIHQHSLRLLENEIRFFEDADLPKAADNLWDFLSDMKRDAQVFASNECLLRLGFGTGYRNMTGDWVKELILDDGLYEEIATETRRTSRYSDMPLPKSRKMMFDGVFMGYVKLTIN